MAPIKSKRRIRSRAQSAKPGTVHRSIPAQPPADDAEGVVHSSFSNKRDKQRIRHSALLHKIASSAGATTRVGKNKRRRPAKRLAGDIGGLLSALPDIDDDADDGNEDGDEWHGISDEDDVSTATAQFRLAKQQARKRPSARTGLTMHMKTVKSRPGAMRRKAKLETTEKERFAKNMAQMAPGKGHAEVGQTSANQWSSLRNFITQTMQQSKLFTSGEMKER
ncbi:hypothetical protein CAC42_365 [Sphaceloma murrayae]|uniref:Ribosome biogenesis protein SLX9 n=1 Tax=Sphaceloma murrayae TaxID=2082308 RepID=A0A2K1R023_9PEZI|nr:hypothetical protein CAC42_365 [Sphaceloma murrayae]